MWPEYCASLSWKSEAAHPALKATFGHPRMAICFAGSGATYVLTGLS